MYQCKIVNTTTIWLIPVILGVVPDHELLLLSAVLGLEDRLAKMKKNSTDSSANQQKILGIGLLVV